MAFSFVLPGPACPKRKRIPGHLTWIERWWAMRRCSLEAFDWNRLGRGHAHSKGMIHLWTQSHRETIWPVWHLSTEKTFLISLQTDNHFHPRVFFLIVSPFWVTHADQQCLGREKHDRPWTVTMATAFRKLGRRKWRGRKREKAAARCLEIQRKKGSCQYDTPSYPKVNFTLSLFQLPLGWPPCYLHTCLAMAAQTEGTKYLAKIRRKNRREEKQKGKWDAGRVYIERAPPNSPKKRKEREREMWGRGRHVTPTPSWTPRSPPPSPRQQQTLSISRFPARFQFSLYLSSSKD